MIRTHDALGADEDTGPAGPVAVFALLFLVVIAPLMRGGNRHVALIVLEGAALVLLVALLGRTKPGSRRVSFQGALLLFLLTRPAWLALVYLLPVPAALWAATAGREGYLPALGSAGIESPSWLPLSLVPDATLSSVLAGIPLAAAFCAGYRLQPSPLALVLRAFVVLVFLQVIVGLLQVAGGSDSSLYFGDGGGRPLGVSRRLAGACARRGSGSRCVGLVRRRRPARRNS